MSLDYLLQFLPFVAWAALVYLLIRWLFRYWESSVVSKKSFQMKFPVSPMIFLSRKIVINSLISDDKIKAEVKRLTDQGEISELEINKKVRGYANELVPSFKAVFYFSIGYWFARGLLLTLYRAKIVRSEEAKYAKIGRDSTIVLFMNHRSNIDVLLVNYLLSRHSVVSHAAGEWARLWPFHHLVKLAGGYVVDRNAQDPLYRLVLKRYVQMSVANGIHLGIFPEGGLTRDGHLQPLNFGLLNYVATASWPGLDRDVVFIPVSFNYDRVPEQDKLVFSNDKKFRDRGKLYLAYSSLLFCIRFITYPFTQRRNRFGWGAASFGEPISLKAWQRSRGVELVSLSDKEKRNQINVLGEQLMGAVQDMIPVMPVHLMAHALLDAEGSLGAEGSSDAEGSLKAIDQTALFDQTNELYRTLQATQAPVFRYDTDQASANAQALYTMTKLGMVEHDEKSNTVRVIEEQIPMLHYYANSAAHYFKPDYSKSTLQQYPIEFEQAKSRSKKFLSLMMSSYDRVCAKEIDGKDFFERFYEHFLATSPEIKAKFIKTDIIRLHDHLRNALEHIQDYFISGKPSKRLRQVAIMHGKSGHDITPDFYQYWLESLLATVAEYDDEFDGSIHISWQTVVTHGIAYMTGQYNSGHLETNIAEYQVPRADDVSMQDISHWIDHWADRSPDKVALIGDARQLTYLELAKEAQLLAGVLHYKFKLNAGDTVAFLGLNCPEFIVLSFACARLGIIVVPINCRLALVEQQRFIERANSKIIIVDQHNQQSLLSANFTENHNVVILDDSDNCSEKTGDTVFSYTHLLQSIKPFSDHLGDIDSSLFILFTSGSTGEPKGAVSTQRAVHWNALNSRLMHDMRQSDLIATSIPFFHAGGINIQTLPALQVGASVRIFSNFDLTKFIDYVQDEKPTLTVLVPAQMQEMMKLDNWDSVDMTSIRAVSTGSTIVSTDLIRAWSNKGIPVIQIYGCTESGPIAVHQTIAGVRSGLGSVGHPAMFTELRIIDKNNNLVKHGTEGEILLRGPSIMSHYWQDEQATRDAFVDGWLLTGDMGYEDEDGRLHIVGRKKRLIISGGENIHPAEIEQMLELHPSIEQAAVIGIDDPKWAEVPMAIITLVQGTTFEEQSIREHLNQHLGRYKHPKHIIVVDTLPLTSLGKVAYPEVTDIAMKQLATKQDKA